ncbi:hypothetical protein PIB30_018314 [Stylosanthes scabra]|uniref:F-box domain-containing protein n=1 Tax=Stylosanthes scabra TaxID=79078 RepID=A0ABU6Z4P8_9FABA|nr:hypothetical protein [Stylosanthes scabra]
MLPTDLVLEILLRSYAPTIGRCGCVSHEWNQLLRGEAFLSEHHKLCSSLQPSFLFHAWYSQWHGNPNAFFRICAKIGQRLYFPLLPHLPDCVDVNIIGNQNGNMGKLDNEFLMFQLYSSEDQKWSRTTGCARDFYRLGLESLTLNGEVYWIKYSATGNNLPESIICYSVVSKIWNVLNLTPNYHSVCHSLIEYQGRIALLYLPGDTNDHTLSIVSLREKIDSTLSWRVEVKIPGLEPHDMPKFLDHQDIISLAEVGDQGILGMEGIILSRFQQSRQYKRSHLAYFAWSQEMEVKYVNHFALGMFPV